MTNNRTQPEILGTRCARLSVRAKKDSTQLLRGAAAGISGEHGCLPDVVQAKVEEHDALQSDATPAMRRAAVSSIHQNWRPQSGRERQIRDSGRKENKWKICETPHGVETLQ